MRLSSIEAAGSTCGGMPCCARASARTAQSEASSMRFWMLVLSLIATAVIVTVAMFETLYYLLG